MAAARSTKTGQTASSSTKSERPRDKGSCSLVVTSVETVEYSTVDDARVPYMVTVEAKHVVGGETVTVFRFNYPAKNSPRVGESIDVSVNW